MTDVNAEQIAEAQAFQRHEMGEESASERRWSSWLKAAEALAVADGRFRKDIGPRGSPLDGDEPSGDAYSLDGAYEAWERGQRPKTYIDSCVCKIERR